MRFGGGWADVIGAATGNTQKGEFRRPTSVAEPSSGPWLFSARADFWGAAAGGGVLLAALALVLAWRGDRELSVADIVLGELHLGATYDAIVRRRLWVRMPVDVLVMPLAIVAATYLLILNDHALLVTTTVLYLGAWHRGRQALGIARHYQRRAGGPVSPAHRWLLSAAFYLPMIAAVAYYTSTAPDHEGEPFHQLALGPDVLWALAGLAGAGVLAYLALTIGRVAVPGREPSGTCRRHAGRHSPRRTLARSGERAGLWQRLRARRLEFVVRDRPRHSPRGAVSLLYLRRRAADPGQWSRRDRGDPPAGAVRGVAGRRARVLGGVHDDGDRRSRALPDRRASRPLLAGRAHLERARAALGDRQPSGSVIHARRPSHDRGGADGGVSGTVPAAPASRTKMSVPRRRLSPQAAAALFMIHCRAASTCPAGKCLIVADTKCDTSFSARLPRAVSVTTAIFLTCL